MVSFKSNHDSPLENSFCGIQVFLNAVSFLLFVGLLSCVPVLPEESCCCRKSCGIVMLSRYYLPPHQSLVWLILEIISTLDQGLTEILSTLLPHVLNPCTQTFLLFVSSHLSLPLHQADQHWSIHLLNLESCSY